LLPPFSLVNTTSPTPGGTVQGNYAFVGRVADVDRIEQLIAWGLSPPLIALARGEVVHPLLRYQCQEPSDYWGVGLDFDRVGPLWPIEWSEGEPYHLEGAAVWGRDAGDGHWFEVMWCCSERDELRFYLADYPNDCEPEPPELIARSEQGLLFWLYCRLLDSGRDEHEMNGVAEAIGFKYPAEAIALFDAVSGSPESLRIHILNVAD